ncbi:MAG: hypothetical protein P8X74_08700 [Reinekea sp.]
MTEASVRRLHSPVYSASKYPPLPPRIRLAAQCWERVWWFTLSDPVNEPDLLHPIVERFMTDSVNIRAYLRTRRRICFAITTRGLDEQSDFEIAMMIMAKFQQELGMIERVEDRPATAWPINEF